MQRVAIPLQQCEIQLITGAELIIGATRLLITRFGKSLRDALIHALNR